MTMKVFIRKECKNKWERRTPLIPDDVKTLIGHDVKMFVEKSPVRIYPDQAYADAGATLLDHCEEAEIVLGIKEPSIDHVLPNQIHVAFSHTMKGQAYNMDLLQAFMDRGCTLIDYEPMKDETDTRIIAFGRYAGIAGAIDTFHVAGRKYADKGVASILEKIQMTHEYGTIAALKEHLGKLGEEKGQDLRVLIVGTGNVGRGCEEVCQWMNMRKITVDEMVAQEEPHGTWYCVVKTKDVVKAKDGSEFSWPDYLEHGIDKYDSNFERFLGRFDILLQTPYWTEKYPKQLPRETLVNRKDDLPMAIGDISCDIDGSLACTLRESTIDEPAFTYQVDTGKIEDGIAWDGPTIMAIDHLPCELSLDASGHFSRILSKYIDEIAHMNMDAPLSEAGLSPEIERATIVYKGELTPAFKYLEEFLANR